jgi:DNA polymerase-3 subunit delta
MPIDLFWGDDSYALSRAVKTLQANTVNPDWSSFNLTCIPPEQPDALIAGLNQAMTPPFGMGNRLVWLMDTPLMQRCPEGWLDELERTLPVIPATTTLLLTSSSKPDGRLKSTKLLQKYATIQEFSAIPPWKTNLLAQQVRKAAQELDIRLTSAAVDYLVEAVGNNTRQLYSELEKIRLWADDSRQPVDVAAITPLVTTSNQNTFQLGAAIRQGQTAQALALVRDLLAQNEPALRIVSTLVGQLRQRLWIKVLLQAGERNDTAIAQSAEIGNPKQLYFLKQELVTISVEQLQQTLPLLLELEFSLKQQGGNEVALLQTKVIELCQLFQPSARGSQCSA